MGWLVLERKYMLPTITVPPQVSGVDARFLTAFDVGAGAFDRFVNDHRALTGSMVCVTPRDLADVLTSERLYIVVCYSRGRLIGLTSMTAAASLEGLVGIIQRLIVLDQFQKQGLGSMMVTAMLDIAAYRQMVRVELAEQVSAHGDTKFAMKHGFRQRHRGRQSTEHMWYIDRSTHVQISRFVRGDSAVTQLKNGPPPGGSLIERMAQGYN